MQSQSRLLDDLARLAGGAAGVAGNLRSEAETRVRELVERVVEQMDLVTRDQYEAVHAMAQQAREDQEALQTRVDQLEARLAELESKQTSAKGGGKSGGQRSKNSGKSAGSKASGSSSERGG
ncbi:BMFP domain-containing protein YqiC [Limimonas halophila]|uniref:BMFP domain-containing protein YqiC n=1 Tax=Limimonas halophila TaxID=1082479 RepID=A0A1G7LEA5_9PROT|nr:accessory factor UbiK family protein [Limimonas halophila]SDF47731.1 BMFP domain-containing protein YqiC [Limimonas halophila]